MAVRKSDQRADESGCIVPGCLEERGADYRGLCESHWWTHRGLALPEPGQDDDAGSTDAGTDATGSQEV